MPLLREGFRSCSAESLRVFLPRKKQALLMAPASLPQASTLWCAWLCWSSA